MDILSLNFIAEKLAELAAFEEKALETGATRYDTITEANLLRFHIQSRMREFGMGLQEGLNSDSFYGYIRRAVDLLLLLMLEDTQQQEYGVVSPECLAWEYQRGFPMVSPDYRFDPRSKLKRRAPPGSQGQRPSKRRRVSPPSQQQHHQQQQQPATPPRRSPSPDLRVQWPSRCYGRRPPPRPYHKRPEGLFDQLCAAPAASTSAAATATYTSDDDDSTSSTSSASTATASTATASTVTASTSAAASSTAAVQPTYSPPGSLPGSPPASPPPAAAARPLPPPPRRQLPPRAARQQAVAAIAAIAAPPVAVRRRSRCGSCADCRIANCGHCKECRDMPRFGGTGRRKQCCISRRCSRLS